MRFLCKEQLSEHKYKTPEGYLVCVDSILARTGAQTYLRKEVFGDSCENGDEQVSVMRNEKEVFDERSIASFENKPIAIEHPDENINPENHRDYSVGFVRDVHRGERDGEQVLLGTLVITDQEGIEAIESGKYTDLSCGYDCDIDDVESPEQRNIRGNHVALCEHGRAGIARVIDSQSVNDEWKIEKGKTYTTRDGNKITVLSIDPHISEYDGSCIAEIQYKYECLDGRKGTSKCNNYSFYQMMIGRVHDSVEDQEDNSEFFYKAAVDNKYYVSVDPAKIKELNPKSSNVWILEQNGNDFIDMIGGKAKYNTGELGSKIALENYLHKKGNCIKLDDSELKDVNPREGESKEDFISRFMSETKEEYPDEKQRLAVAYSYWEESKKVEDAEKTFVIVQSVMGSNYKVTLWESDTAEHALQEFLQHNPQWAKRKLKAIHYNEWKGTAFGKDEQVEDALKEYEIHWIDTYAKSKGYPKDDYAHHDNYKATSVDDALEKLAKKVALSGIGTHYALVVNVRSGNVSYQFSGRLSDLLKQHHEDSVEDEDKKVKDIHSGYVIVLKRNWEKFRQNAYIEAAAHTLDEAQYVRSSLEKNDKMSFVIIDGGKQQIVDSVKDVSFDKKVYLSNTTDKIPFLKFCSAHNVDVWTTGEYSTYGLKGKKEDIDYVLRHFEPMGRIDVEKEDPNKFSKKVYLSNTTLSRNPLIAFCEKNNVKMRTTREYGVYELEGKKEKVEYVINHFSPPSGKFEVWDSTDSVKDESIRQFLNKDKRYLVVISQEWDENKLNSQAYREFKTLEEAKAYKQRGYKNGYEFDVLEIGGGKFRIIDSAKDSILKVNNRLYKIVRK